jgi:hypothetical protein
VRSVVWIVAGLLLLACGGLREESVTQASVDSGSETGATTNAPTSASSTAMATSTSAGSEASASETTGDYDPKLDVAAPETSSGGPTTGCTAVDILFVIDNSGSMCNYQSSLAQTLPDFADAMFEALPGDTSLHVAITTTSFSSGGSHSEVNCESVEGPAEIEDAYVAPDEGMIAGNGFQGRLLEYEGQRWFEADTGDPSTRLPLMEWFANAAFSVNCDGGSMEFPAAAAGYAFDPMNAATNDGFVRDEGAVLVLFVLSDEVDQSPEGIDRYRDQVLAAKEQCGGSMCVITGGLLNAGCVPDANPFVWQFLGSFEHEPVWGSIGNEAGYEEVVRDTLTSVITQTCELIPAG